MKNIDGLSLRLKHPAETRGNIDKHNLKLIAVIDKANDYSPNKIVNVFDGYVANENSLISVKEAYEKGACCFCCKYSEWRDVEDSRPPLWCNCNPHNKIDKSDNDGNEIPLFTQDDFQVEERHECDERLMCEFFRFKDVSCFSTLSELLGDYRKEYRIWYGEQCDDDFFSCALSANCELLYLLDIALSNTRKICTELKDEHDSAILEINEMKEFLNFFNEEIPDTYKKLMGEYKKRKQI